MHRRSSVVILLAAFVLAAIGIGVWRSHTPAKRAARLSVDAEIVSAWASPDFSRIALVLKKKSTRRGWDYDRSVAIFDPVAKKIVSTVEWYADEGSRPCWSPDGKWLAVKDANEGLDVLLLKRDSRDRRILHLGKKSPSTGNLTVNHYAWRPSAPDRLVFSFHGVPAELREYDAEMGKDRLISREDRFCYTIEGLFPVKGELCAAYLAPNQAYKSYDRVFVEDIDSRRRILELPLNGMSFDGMDFDMSPDGEMFLMRWGESLSVDMIVGNTNDVATTWTHPWRLIMSDGGNDIYPKPMISWNPVGDVASMPWSWSAIMNSTQGYLLLSYKGGWEMLKMLPERSAVFSWWKDNTYLAIDKEGLWITNNGRNLVNKGVSLPDPYKEKLILRHKPAGR